MQCTRFTELAGSLAVSSSQRHNFTYLPDFEKLGSSHNQSAVQRAEQGGSCKGGLPLTQRSWAWLNQRARAYEARARTFSVHAFQLYFRPEPLKGLYSTIQYIHKRRSTPVTHRLPTRLKIQDRPLTPPRMRARKNSRSATIRPVVVRCSFCPGVSSLQAVQRYQTST